MAKTVRTCRQLLKVEPALWLFLTVEGLEPTNNAAERAIRPAVLWRRTSFGSQSEAGSVFVAMLFIALPFIVRTLQPVLQEMEKEVEEAALSLGASSWQIFWRVIFPTILPAILTHGWPISLNSKKF